MLLNMGYVRNKIYIEQKISILPAVDVIVTVNGCPLTGDGLRIIFILLFKITFPALLSTAVNITG